VQSSVACGGVVMVSPERVVAERESEMGMRVGRVYTMLMFCCSSPVCFCVIDKERERECDSCLSNRISCTSHHNT
jgi:hypothetical protein